MERPDMESHVAEEFYKSWDDGGRNLEGVFKLARDKVASTLSLADYTGKFKSTVECVFGGGNFHAVVWPLLAGEPRPQDVKIFIVACLMQKQTRDKLAKKHRDVHKAFRAISLPILISEDVLRKCIEIIKESAQKSNISLALDKALEEELEGHRDKVLEKNLKRRREDGITEWGLYCRLVNPQIRALIIHEGADYFAPREPDFAVDHSTDGALHPLEQTLEQDGNENSHDERSRKRRCLSHQTEGLRQGGEGDYELDQSMASGGLLGVLDFYLNAFIFNGLEESCVRAEEGNLVDITAHVLLSLPRNGEVNFKLFVSLSAKVGNEVAQAKADGIRNLRRKFGSWLSEATGLRHPASLNQGVDNLHAVDASHIAAAAAVQVFPHKNGLDSMLQMTLLPDMGWFLMENVFSQWA